MNTRTLNENQMKQKSFPDSEGGKTSLDNDGSPVSSSTPYPTERIGINVEIGFVDAELSEEDRRALCRQLGLTEEECNILVESKAGILHWLGCDKERWAIFLSEPLLVLEKVIKPTVTLTKKLQRLHSEEAKRHGESTMTYIKQLAPKDI